MQRKPFQGVLNIIKFNWHFYLIAFFVIISLVFIRNLLTKELQLISTIASVLITTTILISLIISYYIYDCSDIYKLNWLQNIEHKKVLNINAGFDEISSIIKNKFPKTELTNCDFFDEEKHTEVSLKRARLAYPPSKETISISTTKFPFNENSFDIAIAFLSAHEIRNKIERIQFLNEINRILKKDGRIFITEHLRDFTNFLAFTIGFLHFHSKPTWLASFAAANLVVEKELKTTPFITTFILKKNGNTY